MVEATNPQSDAALEHFLNSHKKVSAVVRLGTEVLEHPNRYAMIVGYFIVRASEKELTDIGAGLKK